MALSTLHGVFPILKPTRITSAQALNRLKEKLLTEIRGSTIGDAQHTIKMGHGGTLDSCASGVLEHVTENVVKEKLSHFLGRIQQVPPAYSALKKDGKRYSDWTKEGVSLDIAPREVCCYELKLQDFTPPFFTLLVEAGSGFYVRSLVHDLGHAVGSCAHLTELERTKQGPLSLSDALTEHQWTLDAVTSSITKHSGSINKYYRSHQLTSKTDMW
ncbi:putative tRNA pseudouridine synthase 1 [Chionoecetes opilio]|uniref:tRNA pseudouridine(55) synthase n=1 Tax=Chionoecetes opilio TaxID=41210 RepID=A0A8J5CG01_CHIOP|nr:putative tRNA pseudouridine synthase 1 [Chionoecetes opilio]